MKFKNLIFPEPEKTFDLLMANIRKTLREKKVPEEKWDKIFTEEFVDGMIDDYHLQLYKPVVALAHKTYADNLKSARKSERIISKHFQSVFKFYSVYVHIGFKLYREIQKQTTGQRIVKQDRIIIPLYGTIFRMADQIGIMMMNGYTDGALRLWRSLYEHVVILLLFLKNYQNGDLSGRFIDHQYYGQRKRILSLSKHGEALMKTKVSPAELKRVEKQSAEFEKKYGTDFLESEYAWAKPLFPDKKRITFREIEAHVGIDRLRPFYLWTSEYNHANFTSLHHFMKENRISVGAVLGQEMDFQKFIDPLQFTLGALDEANMYFLDVYAEDSEFWITRGFFKHIFEKMMESMERFKK